MTAPFLLLTVAAIIVGQLSFWSWGIPFGGLATLALLYWMLRRMRRQRDAAPSGHDRLFNPETIWTLFAASCLFAGTLAGMLAFNPDGYMQPGPHGTPWMLVWPGTLVGAVIGAILASFMSLANRVRSRNV